MGFHAEPRRIHDCAKVLRSDGESTGHAADYARTTVNLESENGAAFAYVADRHREVTQALGEAFSHLAQLLDSAGQELEASADL